MLINVKHYIVYLILISLLNLTLFQKYYLICSESNGKSKVETYNNNCCIKYNSYHFSEDSTNTLSQKYSPQLSEYCIDTEYNVSLYNKNSSIDDLIKILSKYIFTPTLQTTDNSKSPSSDFTYNLNSQHSSIISSTVMLI